ncbi:MAG: PKD domain-containing protein [Fibrobacteria bacterium]|nr:PKD domain-containing protein [Fibrobacteria bacterium]
MKVFKALSPYTTVLFFLSITAYGKIVINEVLPADEASVHISFVELKNTGSGSQNLHGWVLKYTPSNGKQDNGGFLDNLGVTGYFVITNVSLGAGETAVFYFGASGTNSSKTIYMADMNPIPPFANISLYSRGPDGEHHGGAWYGTSLHDFIRFGTKNPPREIIWDRDSYSGTEWIAKHAAGNLGAIYVKYNQWPDTNTFINTKGLPHDASLSLKGDDTNSPDNWIFTSPTPGANNGTTERPPLPPDFFGPVENNSQATLQLTDTRHILYAVSFDHYQQGDYPRDWYYHMMSSDIKNPSYNAPPTITGSFAVNKEYGHRGLWVTPSSLNVCNHNAAAAVFGDVSWTDYRFTFTVKETTGDFFEGPAYEGRHQLCQFYLRLKEDTTRIEGYQFNFIGSQSISVRNWLKYGADFGTINIHRGVDFWGGGEESNVFTQLAKNTDRSVNPAKDLIYVTLEAKGDKITATYDNKQGNTLTMSATDATHSSGMVGLGLVYGNYVYNDILVEDISANPTGSVPVSVVSDMNDTYAINTPVSFSAANSIYSGDQSNLTYLWDFGDGIRGTGQRPQHSFAAVGTYRVTCTISDGENQTTDGFFLTITGPHDATAPTDVIGLTAAASTEGVHLNWNAATDTESGVSGYVIYRGTSASPSTPLLTVTNVTSFVDAFVELNTTYYYRVKALNGVKATSANFSNSANTTTSTTGFDQKTSSPARLILSRNSFGGMKEISFFSPVEQSVHIQIFSSNGRLINSLYKGKITSGFSSWSWKAPQGTGIYLIKIKTENAVLTAKAMVIQ